MLVILRTYAPVGAAAGATSAAGAGAPPDREVADAATCWHACVYIGMCVCVHMYVWNVCVYVCMYGSLYVFM